MKAAHFFDLDVLIRLDSSVWMVSKIKPKYPIIKISQSEFNLIRSGIYKKFGCLLNISGNNYYLPENLYNTLKIKCKKQNIDITDLAFSMQEFLNPEIIEELEFKILDYNFAHLKNSNDDVYIICSKSSKISYDPIIKKLESHLFNVGLKPKNYYFISQTFYNKNSDEISHKKIRLLLQHLVGFKTEGDKFMDENVEKYQKVYFYENDQHTLNLAHNVNGLLNSILSKTEDNLNKIIKSQIKEEDLVLEIRKITDNIINPFYSEEVKLENSHLIKTFENFIFKF